MNRELALIASLLPGSVACTFDPRGSAPLEGGGGDAAPGGDDDDPLLLLGPGRYLYDTTSGVLRLDGGDPVDHDSDVRDGVRQLSAASVVLGAGAELRVEGELPFLIVAMSTIEIAGTLDASSSKGGSGAGADPEVACGAVADFAPGGTGGDGGGDGGGGAPGLDTDGPIELRGGCPGEAGVIALAEQMPAAGGSGGGAVALRAGTRLSVSGRILAGGDGGGGGALSAGGGGGGSGGLAWLEAPDIALGAEAILAANGGGGGEGGDVDDTGDPGEAAGADGRRAHHGSGAANDGGDGGDGAADRDASGKAGRNGGPLGGGGGGGGAGGLVRLSGRVADAGAHITPEPPSTVIAPDG